MKKFASEFIFEIAKTKKREEQLKKKVSALKYGIIKTNFVVDEVQGKKLGRQVGHYSCFGFDEFLIYDMFAKDFLANELKKDIIKLLKINNIKPQKILVVGLGNPKFACDSLGKIVADKVLITTPYLDKKMYSKREMARVFAISPGVYGTTGIDSAKLTKSICDLIMPDVVIAIDSLVATKTKSLAKNIQLSDTSLSPGGGVGNARQDISENTIGTKVFAIGVPLVVKMQSENENLIVTPNDIEKQVLAIGRIVAKAISKSFTNISEQEFLQLIS